MAVTMSDERGGILLIVLISLLVVIVLYFGLVVFLWVGVTNGRLGAGTQGQGSVANFNGNQSNIPLGSEGPSHTKASDMEEMDSGGAELVCVRLNGVGGERTPALDRRVARRMIGVITTSPRKDWRPSASPGLFGRPASKKTSTPAGT